MPRNETIDLNDGWTQATNADVTAIRIQNMGANPFYVQRGGATAPAATEGAILVNRWQIMPADMALSELFPGVVGSRVWIFSKGAVPNGASISHA